MHIKYLIYALRSHFSTSITRRWASRQCFKDKWREDIIQLRDSISKLSRPRAATRQTRVRQNIADERTRDDANAI